MKNNNVKMVEFVMGGKLSRNSNLYRKLCGLPPKAKSTKPPTEKQLDIRQKFGLATSLSSKLKVASKLGYYCKRSTKSGHNIVTQCILANAIVGEYPNYQIDYSKIVLSHAKIRSIFIEQCSFSKTGLLSLNWADGSDAPLRNRHDHIFISMYNATTNVVHNIRNAGQRRDLKLEWQLPDFTEGDKVHVWTFMVSENEREASHTLYFPFKI